MAIGADVVVVGAGVIGSSVALELARAGRDVVVVDKAAGAGHGSTSASSAVVRFNFSTRDAVALSWEAYHCWSNWAEHLGGDPGTGLAAMHQVGGIVLDSPDTRVAQIGAMFTEVGVPFEIWDPATLRERVPGIDAHRFWPPKRLDDDGFWADGDGELCAIYTPDAGFVNDPMLASQNLADVAMRHGAQFLFKRLVTEVTRSAGRVSGVVLADGEQISAPVVVNVAGPWSGRVNAMAGVGSDFTVTVRPLRQEVHHVTAPTGFNSQERMGPIIGDLDLGIYLRPTTGDGMLIGGTEPACDPLTWVEDPDAVDLTRTKPVFEAQVTRAARRFPDLGVPNVPRGIAGVYDVASDWSPIYDRTALDGYYVAMGTSGNQFKNAPAVGQLMNTLITAVEGGYDHDAEPVRFQAPRTGRTIDVGRFSRKRETDTSSPGTVLG
ncbi:NAD(P)/FAD-dependent oxidoreductase [Marmoricola sp. RAF53]|uniref:NAD(P)/FAD-dependent oxidoreductase n=1 Tax=Marmoricola sp. RAF53 TaxID=3233059 RepID=UPI003F97BFB3